VQQPRATARLSVPSCQYFLWRRQLRPEVPTGYYPEVIATDGRLVRRMVCYDRQMLFQEFNDTLIAEPIVERIEGGVTPGIGLLGYSMLPDMDSIAILQTGAVDSPSWLAYPDQGRLPTQHAPTIPMRVASYPKIRLSASSTVLRLTGKTLGIRIALREFNDSPGSLPGRLLDHVATCRLQASFTFDQQLEHMPLCATHRTRQDFYASSDDCLETHFEIEPFFYQQYALLPDFQLWIVLTFDNRLFCLPDRWNHFPLAVSVGG
jgi:hypothetical protein